MYLHTESNISVCVMNTVNRQRNTINSWCSSTIYWQL